MSHAATNWAIKQKGLKPATKLLLWHLADCHNGHTGQCNPKQSRLSAECEMSRSTLNLHLLKLEGSGLIQRVQKVDGETHRKRPTHYILAFDDTHKKPENPMSENRTRPQDVEAAPQDVVGECPKTGHGAMSEKQQKPCPKKRHSHVLNSDIKNLGKEPVKEPLCVDEQPTHKLFNEFWKAHPRPRSQDETREAFGEAVADGVDPEWIVSSARKYATDNRGNGKQYVAYSDNWLIDKRWTEFPVQKKATEAEQLTFYADLLNGDKPIFSTISNEFAGKLVAAGLVSKQRMRERGPA